MAKRGQISKAEMFYIESHARTLDVNTLAKDLDRTEGQIQRVLDTLDLTEQPVEEEPARPGIKEFEETTQARKFRIPTGDMFARRFGKDGKSRATIMTPAASQLSDGRRKKTPPGDTRHIHKPMG